MEWIKNCLGLCEHYKWNWHPASKEAIRGEDGISVVLRFFQLVVYMLWGKQHI